MKQLVLIALLIAISNSIKAQDTIQFLGSYKTWIYLNKEPKVIKGLVYNVKDSTVLVSSSFRPLDYTKGKYKVSEIDFKDIRLITYRKNRIIGKSIILGAFLGAATGAIFGYSLGDDPPCGGGFLEICFRITAKEKATFFGTSLGVFGIGLGALSAIKFRIRINGNYDKFNKSKKRIKKRSIIRN